MSFWLSRAKWAHFGLPYTFKTFYEMIYAAAAILSIIKVSRSILYTHKLTTG